jgi:hypothetical protein
LFSSSVLSSFPLHIYLLLPSIPPMFISIILSSNIPSYFLICSSVLLFLSNIHSIRVDGSLGLFIFNPPPPKLTPHVLSEWMVEVCAGDKYRNRYLGCVFCVWACVSYWRRVLLYYSYTILFFCLLNSSLLISFLLQSSSSFILYVSGLTYPYLC